ncbi:MAG: amylo-alpha-1,6-glucosidase [Thermoplasmata archaeon]
MMNYDEEWLISNRNGSYSSSSVSFSNLRTYHGIFVKNLNSRYDRFVLLSKLFEEFQIEGDTISLDSNYYRDVVYPHGYEFLTNFERSPFPTFNYDILGIKMEKRVAIDPYDDVVMISYKFNGKPSQLRLYPLVAFRNYHTVVRQSDRKVAFEEEDNALKFSLDNISFRMSRVGAFKSDDLWYYNFRYPIDEERGSNHEEDLYLPGHFEIDDVPESITISIYSEEHQEHSFEEIEERYINSLSSVNVKNKRVMATVRESTKFITGNNIIAGYYWFGPWGRDTLISLTGLLLVPKRYGEARQVLLNYAGMINEGLIPKTVTEEGNYDTADSSLWFIYAIYKYFQYSKDADLVRLLYPKMLEIIGTYINGNDLFGMEDFLIRVKKPQLTWMDAKAGNTVFTPRTGKPVEINALWYNALQTVKSFALELNMNLPENIDAAIPETKKRFQEKFVKGHIILDVSEPDDYSIRPNSIFAFSLPFPVLDGFEKYKGIFDNLLTPYGLRSLSSEDKRYNGTYEGDQYHRDSAYHNGSIWPWLAGPYITASVRAGGDRKELISYFKNLFSLQYIPEIFDGDPPYRPKGCIVQAWSYAELIRAYFEDLRR